VRQQNTVFIVGVLRVYPMQTLFLRRQARNKIKALLWRLCSQNTISKKP